MRLRNLALLLWLVTSLMVQVSGQTAEPRPSRKIAAAEKEVRQFYDEYAEDLRQHRREAIADRYDRRGVFLMGNGNKRYSTFEALKDRYVNKWKGPKSFKWIDMSFEVLTPNVVAVLGKFEWQTADGKLFNYSYTGVLIKRDGKWCIRVEDESSGQ